MMRTSVSYTHLLFTVLGWAGSVEIDIGRWPTLLAFQQRIGQRQSVRDALAAEG